MIANVFPQIAIILRAQLNQCRMTSPKDRLHVAEVGQKREPELASG